MILLALVVCLGLLQRQLWFGQASLPHAWHLGAQIQQERNINHKLKMRNGRLWAEVKNLKHGDAAIEEHAREDLGMVKKGEIFYQIIRAPAVKTKDKPAAAASAGIASKVHQPPFSSN